MFANSPPGSLAVIARYALALLATFVMLSPSLLAGDAPGGESGDPWTTTAELGFVTTRGNAEVTTLGFKSLVKRVAERSELELELGAVLSEARSGAPFAVGALDDYDLREPARERSAERYYGKLRYDQRVVERLFWYVSADAERDLPADIDHRGTASGGVSNVWVSREALRFRTSYGLSLTSEQKVEAERDRFGGYRLGFDMDVSLAENATFEAEMTLDGNVEEAEDYRVEAINAVSVGITPSLAIRASLRAKFRNEPALRSVRVFDGDPDAGAGEPVAVIGTVNVPRDELDLTASTSLVYTF